MSPNYKTRGILSVAASLLCAATLWNCSGETSHENANAPLDGESTKVALKLEYQAPPLLDSLVLDCYGADTLHLVHNANEDNFTMDLFPHDNWTFKAKVYANGNLMQVGELETKLSAGDITTLNIKMHPIVGFVYVDIPLGLSNAAGVKRGVMTLTSEKKRYEIPLTVTASNGTFKSGMLDLGANYDVSIILLDAEGNEIYKLTDKFLLTEDSPVPNLTLNSLRSQVNLAIQAATEKQMYLTLPLPAGYRMPRPEELILTEYCSAPDTKDTTQYEFVEIFNGSLDTLILDDCSLSITNGSTTKSFALTVSEINPAQVLVLGSTNSDNTPAENLNTEGWLDLANTKGAIALKCGGTIMDELYYASETDSLHTNVVPALNSGKYGLSGQLIIDQWETRKDSSAWKLAAPTPGKI